MPIVTSRPLVIPIQARRQILSFAFSPVGTFQPNLEYELLGARWCGSAFDLPRMTFMRRHGTLFHPHQSAFSVQGPEQDDSVLDQWVNLQFSGPTGLSGDQFIGLVVHEQTKLFGADEGLTGVQVWTAFGPFYLLRHIDVNTAFWLEEGGVIESERVPSFNGRDVFGQLVGNRSASQEGASFVFGGTSNWTRRQAVDYLLARFANRPGETWRVTGDTALIDVANDTIEMGKGSTLANSIRRILSPTFGMDFTVEVTSQGFEIRVFSLAAREVTYLGATIPRNPRQVAITVGERVDMEEITFNRTFDQRFSKLRIRGSRIVVTTTLDASRGHLIPKWSTALETEYKAGTGTPADSAELHDAARQRPKLQSVYTTFGAPNPFALSSLAAAITLDESGAIASVDGPHPSSSRATLAWTPLRAGFDYATGAEVENVLAGHEADFQRPAAWLFDEGLQRFMPAEAAAFSVFVPRNDWGVVIVGDVAHRLALNNFAAAAGTEAEVEFDHSKTVATIAIQLDTRLTMEAFLDDGADDGTVKEIEMAGMELWVIAPGTAVGVDSSGSLEILDSPLVLRDDRQRMAFQMAAAIVRYLMTRGRAEMNIRGYQPWASAVGSILSVIEATGLDADVGAPITSVDFEGGEQPRTIIRAGYQR